MRKIPVLPGETPQEWAARVLAKEGSLIAPVELPKARRKKKAQPKPPPEPSRDSQTMREQHPAAVRAQIKISDETYQRVRAACCEFSAIDVDEHAARVTLDVLNARAVARFGYGMSSEDAA